MKMKFKNPLEDFEGEEFTTLKIPLNWVLDVVKDLSPMMPYREFVAKVKSHREYDEILELFFESNKEVLLEHHRDFLNDLGDKVADDPRDFAGEALAFFGMSMMKERRAHNAQFN